MAEGYATAASIYEATGKPVIMLLMQATWLPLPNCCTKTASKRPCCDCVDNDASQTGIKKARQAAALLGDRATAIQPEFL